MNDFHIQREYGAAVEAHYGLKGVVSVSMPLGNHDETLVLNIGLMVTPADLKAIAARFAGEVPAKTSTSELTIKLDTSLVQDAVREMLEPGAMYLPASAVTKWAAYGMATVGEVVDFGAIVAK